MCGVITQQDSYFLNLDWSPSASILYSFTALLYFWPTLFYFSMCVFVVLSTDHVSWKNRKDMRCRAGYRYNLTDSHAIPLPDPIVYWFFISSLIDSYRWNNTTHRSNRVGFTRARRCCGRAPSVSKLLLKRFKTPQLLSSSETTWWVDERKESCFPNI